ncbi:serine/threonine protein kinase [Eoetvoesiella caeni]|uniref:Serine/threonine-protein kinase n=1 Tax=Eoetvoesiella caeni TaxID=645616 RepID=A0A366GZK6_9BURK|nr:protein kinase [Eoetvoesiella caeni]MCI2811373.1 protein kinase [Eoetvoesiella caeni]NYT57269.1 protein kinase [Eoetvoesiella caeni]RBP33553.1 serine/threonine-protein kinase [Eoetvoesiella caeni]
MSIIQKWSDSKKWDDNWTVEQEIGGGGQATTKLVKHKENGTFAFLKILNRQTDSERRARFFREASAYATANHDGIPKLVESNAHYHEDSNYKIYLLTEFVAGPTLSKYLECSGAVNFVSAATILKALADTVQYCHENEWIHRDIKPDNIILRESKFEAPILLDFGIAYKDGVVDSFSTDPSQELGNRFLRLPEMSIGSTAKQDHRTDISFLGGILYYLMTTQTPSVLTDHNGRMPHQRALSAGQLKSAFRGPPTALLNFFDHVFSQKLSGRFVSAKEMKSALIKLINMHENYQPDDKEPSIDDVLAAINTKVGRDLAKNKTLYDRAMDRIKLVHSNILLKVQPTYTSYQTGYVNHVDGLRNDLGFTYFATLDHKFVPQFLIQILGDELVVMADGITIYRTLADEPVFSKEEPIRNFVGEAYYAR